MKRLLLTLALLALAGPLYGQIVVPMKVKVGEPIPVSLTAQIPPGATFDGGWTFPDGVGVHEFAPNTYGLWPAKPGTYEIAFSGFWLNLKEVKFKDGDGNEIVIMSYLGHGSVNEKATFVVEGEDGPDPPDPPNPGGKWQMVFFYDQATLDNMPVEQRELLTSLVVRQDLKEKGHLYRAVYESAAISSGVPERYKNFADVVKGLSLPRVALCPIEGGTVVSFPLPASYEDLLKVLDGKEVK